MATVPTPTTYASAVLTSTELNNDRDVMNYLLNKPVARVRSNATQSIATGTYTSVSFQVEDVDDDPDGTGAHSTVTNTSRYTARYAGWYSVSGTVLFAGNATGRRGVRVAVNGSVVNASKSLLDNAGASAIVAPFPVDLVHLNVGDYVEIQALQESGGNLNIGSATTDDNSRMVVKWESN